MTLIVTVTNDGVVTGFKYPASTAYTPRENEVALDDAEHDHRAFMPPRSKRVDTSTDPPSIEDNSSYSPPDVLDRSEIPSELKQSYRDGASVWAHAKTDWEAARDDATAAASAYDAASTTQEMADALDARNTALQAQGDAVATLFNDGVIPALDALFTAAMGEDP